MTQRKLSYIWMALGVVFGIVGIVGLLGGSLYSLLTLAVAALIIYSSIFQLGGWPYVKQDIKLWWMMHQPRRKPQQKKRKHNFKVIK